MDQQAEESPSQSFWPPNIPASVKRLDSNSRLSHLGAGIMIISKVRNTECRVSEVVGESELKLYGLHDTSANPVAREGGVLFKNARNARDGGG